MIKNLSRYVPAVLLAAAILPVSGELHKKTSGVSSPVSSGKIKSVKRAETSKRVNVLPVKKRNNPFSNRVSLPGWKRNSIMPTARRQHMQAPAGVDIPTMYGSIVYNDLIAQGSDYGQTGLYELPKTGASQPDLLFAGPQANYGGVLSDNNIYYATDLLSYWGFNYVMIYGYDVTTGSNEVYIDGTVDNLAPAGITTDPTTGTHYGIFYTEDMSALQLGSIIYDAENCTATTTPISVLDGLWNTISCDAKGQLYAISYEGERQGSSFVVTSCALNRLDKKTGEVTKVGELEGYTPQYLSGSVIDPKTGVMYWNYCTADGKSYMCSINTETAEITTLFKLALNDEIMGIYFPTPEADPKAPGECQSFHADFTGGSLQGTLSFTAPAGLFDGSSATGDVNVTVLVSGDTVMNKKVKYGEVCSTPVSVPEAGQYTFTVFATNDAGEGPRSNLKHVWVGDDTPSATRVALTYEDETMKLSWDAVTSAINGGYLDPEDLTYTVTRYPEGKVVADKIKATSFEETVKVPTDHLEVIYYTVYASCSGLESAPARSETITLGNIVPPYLNTFDDEVNLGGWVIEDSNGDEKTWIFSEYNDSTMRYSFADIDADDWLITPAVKLEKGKAYYVAIDARGTSTTWTERVEMKYGRTQTGEGMTEPLAGPLLLVDNDFRELGNLVIPKEDGIYYIGIHAISDAEMLDLVVDNFQIASGVSALAPGEPADLKVVPDINGDLKAEISFKAPDVDLQGEKLTELTKVEVKRNDVLIKTFENPTPGAELKFTDTPEKVGVYEYTVTGYNTHGTGLIAIATNYVGVNIPGEPVDVKFITTPNSGNVTVSWSPADKDVNGNALLPEKVTYNVYSILRETTLLAENIKDLSYSFQAIPEGKQGFVQCAVCAVTEAGEGEAGFTEMIPVGVPYTSLNETFANGNVTYDFGAESINEGIWNVFTDSSLKDIKSHNGDNGFLACQSMGFDSGAALLTGLIDTKAMKDPAFSMYIYNVVDGEDVDDNHIEIGVRKGNTGDFKTIIEGTVDDLSNGIEGWNRIVASLKDYAGEVVEIKIEIIGGVFIYTCIDDIRVDSMFANDIAVTTLTGSDLVEWGKDVDLLATVENLGQQDATDISVELMSDGTSVATKKIDNLRAGDATIVDFKTVMPPMTSKAVSYTVSITYGKDENPDNNKSEEWVVTPAAGVLPAVTDLAGETDGENVTLTWSEPDLDSYVPQITQDFEDGEAFASEYGDWTFVDGDNSPVGGFRDLEVPGITIGTTTGSFWIWDTASLAGDDPTFQAHSGTHYLFSLFRNDDEQVDDWAISPALHGSAQTIRFYAKSYSSQYAEHIEVYYSTGSLDPKDFIKVAEVKKLPNKWTSVRASLPEGAKRFAIRSCATGAYMLMVDDVTYAPEGAKFNGSILGFDIYRDGVKINDKLVEDFTYTDTTAEKGHEYTYNVIAVYDSGLSGASNSANVNLSGLDDAMMSEPFRVIPGGVEILTADGRQVTLAGSDGIVYYSATPTEVVTVRLNPAIYMLKIGRKTYKVVVK